MKQEFHAEYCPVKNPRAALFLVTSFSAAAFAGWKGLHKPLEKSTSLELLIAILVVAMLVMWLVSFTCFRERLVLSFATVSFVVGEVTRFAPSVFNRYAEVIKSGKLALLLLGLLVSLTMLIQSLQDSGHSEDSSRAA